MYLIGMCDLFRKKIFQIGTLLQITLRLIDMRYTA